MIKSFALFVMGLAIAGFNYKIYCSTMVPKEIIPVQCELEAVTTRSLPQEASSGTYMKFVKGGDDEDEDDKDGAKDKEDGAERLWDSVMLG